MARRLTAVASRNATMTLRRKYTLRLRKIYLQLIFYPKEKTITLLEDCFFCTPLVAKKLNRLQFLHVQHDGKAKEIHSADRHVFVFCCKTRQTRLNLLCPKFSWCIGHLCWGIPVSRYSYQESKVGGGNSKIFYFHPYLQRWSYLTNQTAKLTLKGLDSLSRFTEHWGAFRSTLAQRNGVNLTCLTAEGGLGEWSIPMAGRLPVSSKNLSFDLSLSW